MTSYAEYTCEHAECGYIWVGYMLPEYICPECQRHQYRNGEIFETLKENLRLRITPYGECSTSDEVKGYLQRCRECIEDLEECRLLYESDSAYKEGKARLMQLDMVGSEYFLLMMRNDFDEELFDTSEFFLKHV